MVNIIYGKAGTGKSHVIIEKIKNFTGKFEDIVVVIPDQLSFEFDKKLYTELGPSVSNKIKVLQFPKLAKDIFIKYGFPIGRYADELTKLSVMYRTLSSISKNDSFLFYDKQYNKSSFLIQSLETIKEMHWSNVNAGDLLENVKLHNNMSLFYKASDIAVISASYLSMLHSLGYKDNLNDLNLSSETASKNDYFKGKTVFIDEFYSYSADEYKMLETIISTADDVIISLTLDSFKDSEYDVFNISRNTYKNLHEICDTYNISCLDTCLEQNFRAGNTELRKFCENIFKLTSEKFSSQHRIQIIEASDIYTEIEFTAAKIREIITNCNEIKFLDIAVIARDLTNYEHVIESTFKRYEIPYFMDRKSAVSHKAIVLFITSLLEILSINKPDTESVLRYAKSGFLNIKLTDISKLENYCYLWSINGNMWIEDFPTEDETSTLCNKLRKEIIDPINKLKKVLCKPTAKKICTELYSFFKQINLTETINSLFSHDNLLNSEELIIARETRQLWNCIIDALDTLYNTIGDDEIDIKEFRNLFSLLISECDMSNPPQTLDSVTITALDRCNLNSPKIVFVIGTNDGIMPANIKDNCLFNNKDKDQLLKVGIKFTETIDRKICKERFLIYKAFTAPSEMLFISYYLSGISAESGYPSYVVNQIKDMYTDNIVTRTKDLSPIFFSSTFQAAYYNYIQNYNKNDEITASLREFLKNSSEYKEKLNYLDNVSLSSFHKLEEKQLALQLFGNKLTVSASRFEDFNKCPFNYYCKKGLNIYPLKKVEINSSEQGNVVHACLLEVMSSKTKQEFLRYTQEQLYDQVSDNLNSYYNNVLGGDFGKTSRFIAKYNSLKETITNILIHMQEELEQSEFIPVEFELKVPTENKIDPIVLKSNSGIQIQFIGTVDRVDLYVNGNKQYIRVIDYKTGVKTFSVEDILYGVNMQMLLYLFALTQGNGKYSKAMPAGVLYMPSRDTENSLNRNPDKNDIKSAINKNYKMNGIIIDNEQVISAMEKDVYGIYIPVKKTSGGYDRFSSLITDNQLKNLREYSYKLLCDMAERLYNGDISSSPLVHGNISPCNYCDYREICGDISYNNIRNYSADSQSMIYSLMNGSESNGKQMD